ncbi:MAG: periplasmic heavy metal sensor [Blastocatellia bacterium]
MKKHSVAPILVVIAILLSSVLVSVSAQVRPNPNRERRIERAGRFDPQIGRRRDQLPGRQPGRLNQNQKKKRLQQMVMQAIGLTPDQHGRIRDIHISHDDERISIGRRIRQARQSLDRAIMNERYDEAAVRRATDELAAAQGEKIKLESRLRSEVRNVLTTDQVTRFHQFEREFRRQMRQQQIEQQQQMMEEKETGSEGTRPPQEFDQLDLLSLLFFND